MPRSSPGNEPGSQSESDAPESENSDASSSDFEIQAVTTADGVRTENSAQETNKSNENEQQQNESEAVTANDAAPNQDLANTLGLSAYAESSSSDEDLFPKPAPKSAPKQPERPKKRVRFADDPPEKRQRVEHTNGPMNGSVNGHLDTTVREEADEITVLAQLAEFEAAVADAGRDTDDIEADLADAEDAREDAMQRDLEQRVKRLREAVMQRKSQVKSRSTKDQKDENSKSSDEGSGKGVGDGNAMGISPGRN